MKLVLKIFICLLLSYSVTAQETNYHVLFEYNESAVPDTAMAFLIKNIYSNKVDKIYLEGHCDSIGSRQYNYALSKRRVLAVENLLIENGFDRSKIIGKVGFGKDKPRTPNSTAEARQKNRRVLVRFAGIKPIKKKVVTIKKSTKALKKKTPIKKEIGILISGKTFKKSTPITEKLKIVEAPKPKEFKRENFVLNATIALPGLNFQGGRHFLLKRSAATLDTLLTILKDNPTMVVEIQGHVCCTTTEPDGWDMDLRTQNLSLTRAIAVKAFLVKNKISSTRLKTKGFGGSRKLFLEEDSLYKRERNRRVEVKVISK